MSYTTDKSGIHRLVSLCAEYGISKIVCSPGSRNAPLIIAFDQDPRFETIVIHDERSAGFYAMGIALSLNEPVAVCCTSGTASVNYFPAVAEAFYQSIPLVVITADRPAEWINHGEGQSIMQEHIFGNHVKAACTVPEYVKSDQYAGFDKIVCNVLDQIKLPWSGPVHFNCPLDEPLYGIMESYPCKSVNKSFVENESPITSKDLNEIKQSWGNHDKKLILCGQMNITRNLVSTLHEIASDSSVAVLVENTSNLVDKKFVHCIDRTLVSISEEEIINFRPDLLVTIGGAIVSKKIKAFLRESDIKEHWKIGYEFPEMNTYRALSRSFEIDPYTFFSSILSLDLAKHKSTFGNKWKQRDLTIEQELPSFFNDLAFCDLKAFEVILDSIPENSNIHMSNSSVVRYCQLFDPIASMKYFANRGASGIDGSLSTAAGVAISNLEKLNVLITGDVSFFYDSNALWNNNFPQNIKIILINNGGGGIFKIIDGPSQSDQLEKYFEAKHDFSAEYICKAFNIDYSLATDTDSLEKELVELFTTPGPRVLEVNTKGIKNETQLKAFFNFIHQQNNKITA